MAETEKQEFLSPHQCFIVYDKLTKQIAISIRNRLSEKGVKCTIWDEKIFRENEIRLSNYNRLLILNKEIAEEYLANPSLKSKQLTEYVLYKREGRVASIVLKNEGIDYSELYKKFAAPIEEFQKEVKALEPEKQEKIKALSSEEIVEALAIIQKENTLSLPAKDSKVPKQEDKENRAVKLIKEYGFTIAGAAVGGAVGFILPIPTLTTLAALYGYEWFANKKDAEKCKQLLLFDAAMNFEKELLDDFVNAK